MGFGALELRNLEAPKLATRGKSHAGGVTRPGTDDVTPSLHFSPAERKGRVTLWATDICSRRLCRSLFPSRGGDHPDRHPPHFAPRMNRSPPRFFLRTTDFSHGLLSRSIELCIIKRTPAELRKGPLPPSRPSKSACGSVAQPGCSWIPYLPASTRVGTAPEGE